jgi:hypothetical protein
VVCDVLGRPITEVFGTGAGAESSGPGEDDAETEEKGADLVGLRFIGRAGVLGCCGRRGIATFVKGTATENSLSVCQIF